MRIILFFVILSFTAGVMAEWRPLPSMQQGYELRYDPDSSRVETRIDGEIRPLWDGVHRLENGQVLRIENGIAVRDRTVMQARPEPRVVREEVPACEMLARKSCGLGGSCSTSESCRHAQQLLGFYREVGFGERGRIEKQCREALGDTQFFRPCPVPPKSAYATACSDLVAKSCGINGQCKESESCDLARQLQKMEYDEKLMLLNVKQKTPTTRQCEEVFGDDELFAPCLR